MAEVFTFPASQTAQPRTLARPAAPLSLSEQLLACRAEVATQCRALSAPYPAFTLVFSISDGSQRAHVLHVCASSFDSAWRSGAEQTLALAKKHKMPAPWLRVDWVQEASPMRWGDFEAQLEGVKRNYFRLGLALDAEFGRLLTEQELNANAMLYGGPQQTQASFNRNNFEIYLWRRFAHEPTADFDASRMVYLLSMRGVFCQNDGVVHQLGASGPNAGRRVLPALTPEATATLVNGAAAYLAGQVQKSGQFIYGHFPCFDRRVGSYNTLRHASTLYAMLEAWEFNPDATLMAAIERGIAHLCHKLIRDYTLPDGTQAAFLVDVADEIKLGGNAVCLLALVKYTELTQHRLWLPLLEKLALGMAHMQDAATGRFCHVLDARDLSLKQAVRTVYYDGEAAFGLMRLYGLTRDARWLAMVELAFEHFIARDHWQAHDHWLSYCVNELTRWRPLEKYFRFGVQNVASYLDFVLERKTTFPTLLELMVAAHHMLQRLQQIPTLRHLLDEVDMAKFQRAMDHRANYLLNGHFFPEVAMYFRRPRSVLGAFYIRHHSFRVRIDDVEHYLSGLIGYHGVLQARAAAPAPVAKARVSQGAASVVRPSRAALVPRDEPLPEPWSAPVLPVHTNWGQLGTAH